VLPTFGALAGSPAFDRLGPDDPLRLNAAPPDDRQRPAGNRRVPRRDGQSRHVGRDVGQAKSRGNARCPADDHGATHVPVDAA
jgi:hypothetical protein